MAPEPRKHETQEIDVTADNEILLDKVINQPVGAVDALSPKTRARRDETNDLPVARDKDRLQIICVFLSHGLPQRRANTPPSGVLKEMV